MATTAVIAEIIVIGSLSAGWTALLLLRIFGVSPAQALDWLAAHAPPDALLISGAVILIYHLGWITNWASFRLCETLYVRRLKRRILGPLSEDYELARSRLLQEGSAALVQELRVELSIVRIARSGILNFGLLAVAAACYGYWLAATLLTALAGFSLLHAYRETSGYYQRMNAAFRALGIGGPGP